MTGANLVGEVVENGYAIAGIAGGRGNFGDRRGDRDAGRLEQLEGELAVGVDFLRWNFDILDDLRVAPRDQRSLVGGSPLDRRGSATISRSICLILRLFDRSELLAQSRDFGDRNPN